jgi:D-ribose pyranase
MKKSGILNAQLMRVIAEMGHTDRIAVADSGLPIPSNVPRVDLALVAGVPGFLETVRALLGELKVERAVVASEMRTHSPRVYEDVQRLLAGTPVDQVLHEEFKVMLRDVRAVVRTGEQTPYANIILQSGVTF